MKMNKLKKIYTFESLLIIAGFWKLCGWSTDSIGDCLGVVYYCVILSLLRFFKVCRFKLKIPSFNWSNNSGLFWKVLLKNGKRIKRKSPSLHKNLVLNVWISSKCKVKFLLKVVVVSDQEKALKVRQNHYIFKKQTF